MPTQSHPAPVPEAQWRLSKLSPNKKIKRSNALDQYRLKLNDLEDAGLEFERTRNDQGGWIYTYREIAVERVAWRKHGGPQGWEAYLTKLRNRWNSNPKNINKRFLEPAVPTPRKHATPWERTKGLAALKPHFTPWLWKACNEHVDSIDNGDYFPRFTSKQREICLQLALKELRGYPSRPAEPLPSSPTVDNLRSVLAEAVTMDMYMEAFQNGAKIEGIVSDEGWDGSTACQWSEKFTDRLFGALVAIIEAHGVGVDGWESARWEVYDRYAECFGSVSYSRGTQDNGHIPTWKDNAQEWLLGKLPPNEWRRARHDKTPIGKSSGSICGWRWPVSVLIDIQP